MDSKLSVHPVDQRLPLGKLFTLGLQHVLVMYAGAVAVPLIIGSSLGLPKEQIAFLISADLFCCGVVTLLQCVGVRGLGIRLPVIMAVTFAAVGPMVAIGGNPALGLPGIFGATIGAGATPYARSIRVRSARCVRRMRLAAAIVRGVTCRAT